MGFFQLSVYSTTITFLDKSLNSKRTALSHILELYGRRFALPAIKDFVLNPLHKQWQALHWSELVPSVEDLGRFVTILDTFNPICHEFIGKIFVKFSFDFSNEEVISKISPYFLHCVVKLSAEPEVRKVSNNPITFSGVCLNSIQCLYFTLISYRMEIC